MTLEPITRDEYKRVEHAERQIDAFVEMRDRQREEEGESQRPEFPDYYEAVVAYTTSKRQRNKDLWREYHLDQIQKTRRSAGLRISMHQRALEELELTSTKVRYGERHGSETL